MRKVKCGGWIRYRYCRKIDFNCCDLCRSTYKHVLHEDFILTVSQGARN